MLSSVCVPCRRRVARGAWRGEIFPSESDSELKTVLRMPHSCQARVQTFKSTHVACSPWPELSRDTTVVAPRFVFAEKSTVARAARFCSRKTHRFFTPRFECCTAAHRVSAHIMHYTLLPVSARMPRRRRVTRRARAAEIRSSDSDSDQTAQPRDEPPPALTK